MTEKLSFPPEEILLNALVLHPHAHDKILETVDLAELSDKRYLDPFKTAIDAIKNKVPFTDPALIERVMVNPEAPAMAWGNALYTWKLTRSKSRLRMRTNELMMQIDKPASSLDEINGCAVKLLESLQTEQSIRTTSFDADKENYYNALETANEKQVSWGIDGLDDAALRPGLMAIVAARPTIGKTAFAVNVARSMAQKEVKILFICLEMSQTEITTRFLSLETEYSFNKIYSAYASDIEVQTKIKEAYDKHLQGKPIQFCCGVRLSIGRILQLIKIAVHQYDVKVVIVDYLQLIKHDPKESMRVSVSDSCHRLREIAADLDITVILLAQLNRDAENKQPNKANLKEAGSLEEDAHIVLLLDRPMEGYKFDRDYRANGEKVDMHDKCAVVIAKNRNGKQGVVILDFDAHTMKFGGLKPKYEVVPF